jgi:L-aspartate semialdehyde sulfurtransferase ferredoxin
VREGLSLAVARYLRPLGLSHRVSLQSVTHFVAAAARGRTRRLGLRWHNRGVAKARLHLTFPEHLLSVPVVHRLGTDFGIVTNIRRANLEESGGWIILEVEGDEDRIADAIVWLTDEGLQVDRIED